MTICPVCKDDLVYLPKKVSQQNGGCAQLMVVSKAGINLSLIDPNSLIETDVAGQKYWEHPFEAVLTRKHLTEFVVLDKEDLEPPNSSVMRKHSTKYRLCEVEIARTSDIGVNDERCRVRCHLGNLLEVGDHCLGYDLRTVNISGEDDTKVGGG